jgi:hypothetical protein
MFHLLQVFGKMARRVSIRSKWQTSIYIYIYIYILLQYKPIGQWFVCRSEQLGWYSSETNRSKGLRRTNSGLFVTNLLLAKTANTNLPRGLPNATPPYLWRPSSSNSNTAIEIFTDNIVPANVGAEKMKSIREQFVDYTFLFYKSHPHLATKTGTQNM